MFMGKILVQIPLVTWRDGRPRFVPGPRLRKPPFSMKGEDLRHGATGPWFDLVEAQAWSQARQALIARLAGDTPTPARRIRRETGDTVGHLFERYFASPRMNGKTEREGKKTREPLATNTTNNYRGGGNLIEKLDDGRIWEAPAAATTPTVWAGVFDRIEVAHGLASARKARAAASAMFTWARLTGRFKAPHPIKAIEERLPTLQPRVRFGTIEEIEHLVKAADLLGRPEIGDAIILGVWSGQRQADRLALVDAQETSDGILFRQGKKNGQPLLIPPSPQLRVRLLAIRIRRAEWPVTFREIIVDERARAPFTRSWYSHTFARIRDFAATGMVYGMDKKGRKTGKLKPALHEITGEPMSIQPMPSLADFRDQDLRDTAVTWLALAGCSVPQIASITGHSLGTIDTVLKHYLGMHPELAKSAIGKLVEWFEGKGEGR
jgi:hypothetical protein